MYSVRSYIMAHNYVWLETKHDWFVMFMFPQWVKNSKTLILYGSINLFKNTLKKMQLIHTLQ